MLNWLLKQREYDNHNLITFIQDKTSGLKAIIAIHRNNFKYPSFGATRYLNYPTELAAIKDVLNLSRMMSYKSAMAGFPYGGAKAVIFSNTNDVNKKALQLKTYAQKLNYLNGRFITGTDVGISQTELNTLKTFTPFLIGFKVDPSFYTGLGLLYGLEIALKERYDSEELTKRTFVVQGLGKVGIELLKLIYPQAAKIYVTDINPKSMLRAKKLWPKITLIKPDKIYAEKTDVFCPCALAHTINNKSYKHIRAEVILGGANNQLQNESLGDKLFRMGILYAPDYIVNAGGFISVACEYENKFEHKDILARLASIKKVLQKVFTISKKTRLGTNLVANDMAEKIMNKAANYALQPTQS
jgi:leucine dehydrogenase